MSVEILRGDARNLPLADATVSVVVTVDMYGAPYYDGAMKPPTDLPPIATGQCAKCGQRVEYHQVPYSVRRKWFHTSGKCERGA